MPQPNKIPLAFAASGDKNVIPESTETTGLASWRDGFPAITSTPFSEGGIAPKRADFNGIFNALSQSVMWMQQGGVYAYDADTDYDAGNVVLDGGGLYVANTANGPSSAVVQPSTDTIGATWKLVRLDLATQSAAGYMSAADKTALDNVPTTYLPLSGGTITGVTRAPTPSTSDDSTEIATTAFVNNFYDANVSELKSKTPGGVQSASDAYTNLVSLDLTKGIWLVRAGGVFGNTANDTGYRDLLISTSSTGAALNRFTRARFTPVLGIPTVMDLTCIIECTADSATYYLNVYQNSNAVLYVSDMGCTYMKVRSL